MDEVNDGLQNDKKKKWLIKSKLLYEETEYLMSNKEILIKSIQFDKKRKENAMSIEK